MKSEPSKEQLLNSAWEAFLEENISEYPPSDDWLTVEEISTAKSNPKSVIQKFVEEFFAKGALERKKFRSRIHGRRQWHYKPLTKPQKKD